MHKSSLGSESSSSSSSRFQNTDLHRPLQSRLHNLKFAACLSHMSPYLVTLAFFFIVELSVLPNVSEPTAVSVKAHRFYRSGYGPTFDCSLDAAWTLHSGSQGKQKQKHGQVGSGYSTQLITDLRLTIPMSRGRPSRSIYSRTVVYCSWPNTLRFTLSQ